MHKYSIFQVRFYGCHAILIPNTSRNLYFVVMNNVFRTNKKMHKRYDLKGSWVRRCVGEAHQLNPEKVCHDHMSLEIRDFLFIFF